MPNKLVFSFEDGKVIVEDAQENIHTPGIVHKQRFRDVQFDLGRDGKDVVWYECAFTGCDFVGIAPTADKFKNCMFNGCQFKPRGGM